MATHRGATTRTICLAALVLVLAGCATDGPAPVEDRSLAGEMVAPTREPVSIDARARSTARTHTVGSGDTLYSIAFKNGVDYRDLARWNGIAAPYTIHVGQQLQLSDNGSGVETTAVRDSAPATMHETIAETSAPTRLATPAAPAAPSSMPRASAQPAPTDQARRSEDERLLAEAIAREEGASSAARLSAPASTTARPTPSPAPRIVGAGRRFVRQLLSTRLRGRRRRWRLRSSSSVAASAG